MTKTFSMNDNNDIFIGSDGNLAVSNSINAVLYACENAAQAQRGEMIFETNRGIPNFQITFGGSPNLSLFEYYVKTALKNVDGVSEITEMTTTNENNVLSYSATIKTIYGSGVING